MDTKGATIRRGWAWVAAAMLVVALVLALVDALSGASASVLAWLGVAAAAVGAVLLVLATRERPWSAWALVAAMVPVAYLVLSTAPVAVTREALPVARLLVALASVGAYMAAAAPLASRGMYGVGCACLGVGAVFFLVWEPPPPKPVPIRQPLVALKDKLLARMPGWKGEHTRLPEATEKVLGADEYLNLALKSPDGEYQVLVFVTYNANAMSNIPHVPWVCMTQAGFRLVTIRQDDLQHPSKQGKEVRVNALYFEPGEDMGRQRALMFQYFNVGGTYEWNRQLARIMATSGAIGRRGSYLSQTQVAVWFPPSEAGDPLAKDGAAYQIGLKFLSVLIPLLENEHYPDLAGEGRAGRGPPATAPRAGSRSD